MTIRLPQTGVRVVLNRERHRAIGADEAVPAVAGLIEFHQYRLTLNNLDHARIVGGVVIGVSRRHSWVSLKSWLAAWKS